MKPVNVKTCARVLGALWLLILGLSAVGHLWQASGGEAAAHTVQAVKPVFIALFVAQAFCLAPLAVRLFITLQERIGNGQRAPMRALKQHEGNITWGFWLLWLLGLALALPALLKQL